MADETDHDLERTPEQKLESLIERDLDPEITRLAKNALRSRRERGDSPPEPRG